MWPWWVKIPSEDFAYKAILVGDTMEMILEGLLVVVDMEVGKVVDEVANMKVDKLTDMVVKIANEDFFDGKVIPAMVQRLFST